MTVFRPVTKMQACATGTHIMLNQDNVSCGRTVKGSVVRTALTVSMGRWNVQLELKVDINASQKVWPMLISSY